LFLIPEFDVRFNPDIYAPGTKHAPSEVTLADMAFVLIKVVPEFSLMNIDGAN